MSDDGVLLDAWRSGDRAAGEELFRRQFPALYRFFARRVSARLDDLIQDTFKTALEVQDRVFHGDAFLPFLYGIARNVLARHLRSLGRNAGRETSFAEMSMAASGASAPALLEQAEERRLLARALRHVPIDDQILIELFYFEELTGAQLGTLFEVPEATVRSRLRRALERVRVEVQRLSERPELAESSLLTLQGWAERIARQGSPAVDHAE